MRLLFVLLLLPLFSFSQKNYHHNYSIQQIDSLAQNEGSSFISYFTIHEPKITPLNETFSYTKLPTPNGEEVLIRKKLNYNYIEKKLFTDHSVSVTSVFYFNEEKPYYGSVKVKKTNKRNKVIEDKEYNFSINKDDIYDVPENIKEYVKHAYSSF